VAEVGLGPAHGAQGDVAAGARSVVPSHEPRHDSAE